MSGDRGLGRRVIDAAIRGEVSDRDGLQALKMRLCRELGLAEVPPNSEILSQARGGELDVMEPLLVKKPVRTASGVAVVAVMASPHPCPHGKCMYCPGGVDSPQSYTGKEPAARRAERNGFDPYLQASDRIRQLGEIGHKTDKIDLVVMGGTFTSRSAEYQEWFVRRCLDAMNGEDSATLEEAQSVNEAASRRCVGLTVETRPDAFRGEAIDAAMALGATRVELGVQILDDAILEAAGRGHGVGEVAASTRECKERGLKVCYHIMPGLPGSSPEKDLECFSRVFGDEDFRPDMLKIYPALVVEGTGLYDMWADGRYVPYDVETAVRLLSDMKAAVPEYARIQRIQRDIPAPQIAAGILKSNLRQLVQERMSSEGRGCRCIRCREVGRTGADREGGVEMKTAEYRASGGTEKFISLERGDSIAGYARLRIDSRATVRELKVFGKTAPIGEDGEWQHRGFGRALMAEAERAARAGGMDRLRVTSGIGARRYYEAIGYEREGAYMVKSLDP
ncbi:MAG: tRNA uridine(34) 5-carboxymethylaminomethyl modification radical SAM/GNAT enzyme Elp3 [Candidatus Methanoplasma sp.]|jgi:elongator complex protein 3|nr:tRNA uridine(34) 5-carboxymethylaminomethyl modification radical SAM/GNAT enzyme Elp3 [Candidatus Methanoplasma sp.]